MTEEDYFSHEEDDDELEDGNSPFSQQGFDESEVDFMDGEGLYSTIIPEKNIKKNYDVDFKAFSGKDLIAVQQSEVLHVSNILGRLVGTGRRAAGWLAS